MAINLALPGVWLTILGVLMLLYSMFGIKSGKKDFKRGMLVVSILVLFVAVVPLGGYSEIFSTTGTGSPNPSGSGNNNFGPATVDTSLTVGAPLTFFAGSAHPESYTNPFTVNANDCGKGNTGSTTVTYSVQNPLNTTVSTFDTTSYWYPLHGGSPITVTDSTAGSVTTNCGEIYLIKSVAADGSYGDNSRILRVSPGNGRVVGNGYVLFRSTGGTDGLTAFITPHATIQATGYDLVLNRALFGTSGTSTTAFRNTSASFRNGANNTGFLPGAGSDLNVRFTLRTIESMTSYCDNGCLVGLDLVQVKNGGYLNNYTGVSATFGDQQTNSASLPLMSLSSLTPGEISQMQKDEVLFKMADPTFDESSYVTNLQAGLPVNSFGGGSIAAKQLKYLSVFLHTGAGAPSAANDVFVDIYGRGNYLSANGFDVFTGAFDDSTSKAAVFTGQRFGLDI